MLLCGLYTYVKYKRMVFHFVPKDTPSCKLYRPISLLPVSEISKMIEFDSTLCQRFCTVWKMTFTFSCYVLYNRDGSIFSMTCIKVTTYEFYILAFKSPLKICVLNIEDIWERLDKKGVRKVCPSGFSALKWLAISLCCFSPSRPSLNSLEFSL